MTMQGWTPEQTFNYAIGTLNRIDERMAKEAIIEIGRRLAEETKLGLEAVEQASGMRRSPEPLVRLQWYRTKPQELWEEQFMKFPRRWERDWKDYQNPRQRALQGDFGELEQAAEALMQAEKDLTVLE